MTARTLNTMLMAVTALLTILAIAPVGTAANLSLKTYANATNDNWSTAPADTNWSGVREYFQDGDNVSFGNHNKGSRWVLNIQPAGVAPNSIAMSYWGGEGGAYEFSGGDITGSATFSMTSDGVLVLPRSFSFTGGVTLSHTSAHVRLEPTAPGTYHFGSDGSGGGGVITLNNSSAGATAQGQFRFLPTVVATCDNDFDIGPNGGTIRGNTNALWDSTVTLNGPGRVHGHTAAASWAGLTFDLNGGDRTITMHRGGSSDERTFDAVVNGGGIHNVTFGDGSTSGSTTDYEIVIGGASVWNVNNLILNSPQSAIMVKGTDSQTVFDDVQGKIIVQNAILATTQGSTGNWPSYSGTYYAQHDYEVHAGAQTRIIASTIYVQNGGSISGDGLLHAHGANGVIVNDGTLSPGFSIGTLDVLGNLTLGVDAVYDVEVDPFSSASDVVAVAGDLVLGGTLNVIGYGPDAWGNPYEIMTYTGTVSGMFDDVTGLAPFLSKIDIVADGGIVTFSAIPEPTTLVLLGLGVMGLLNRRRPRG